MEKYTRIMLLYDFYGALLSRRQREATELYYEDNLSLAEIAEEFGITRQGVYDAVKSAEKSLEEYEEKLGLVARFQKRDENLHRVEEALAELTRWEGSSEKDKSSLKTAIEHVRASLEALRE